MKIVLTYEDYAALPDDGKRYEIHEGELSVTPAPGTRHQSVSMTLSRVLDAHVTARRLGTLLAAPTDVILSRTTVVQPDLVFVATERTGIVSERAIEGAPTLAVEIVSPSTTQIDRTTKLQLYARHGIPHYWIVDPVARAIEVYVLGPEDYTLRTRVAGDDPLRADPFPDLTIPTASLWG